MCISINKKKVLEEEKPEWVWVDGYKGTDRNMCCRDYQFELGKRFDMPEGVEIKMCNSGFHFCERLSSVFIHYDIEGGNRFFKVRALVKKSDTVAVRLEKTTPMPMYHFGSLQQYIYDMSLEQDDKTVAKAIEFVSEVDTDELLKAHPRIPQGMLSEWTDDIKQIAREKNIEAAKKVFQEAKDVVRVCDLVGLGYSETFAKWIVNDDKYHVAFAVGSQSGLSMDMKVFAIMQGED